MTPDTPALDQARIEEFMGKTIGDAAGLFASVMAIVGDRLGLFAALADGEPASADELAQRANVDPRYALEWLRGMHAAGTLELAGDGPGACENLKRAIALEPKNKILARQDPEFLALAQQLPSLRALLMAESADSF